MYLMEAHFKIPPRDFSHREMSKRCRREWLRSHTHTRIYEHKMIMIIIIIIKIYWYEWPKEDSQARLARRWNCVWIMMMTFSFSFFFHCCLKSSFFDPIIVVVCVPHFIWDFIVERMMQSRIFDLLPSSKLPATTFTLDHHYCSSINPSIAWLSSVEFFFFLFDFWFVGKQKQFIEDNWIDYRT